MKTGTLLFSMNCLDYRGIVDFAHSQTEPTMVR